MTHVNKLAGFLYRMAGLGLGKEITAGRAVDAKISEEVVSAMLDSTASVAMESIK